MRLAEIDSQAIMASAIVAADKAGDEAKSRAADLMKTVPDKRLRTCGIEVSRAVAVGMGHLFELGEDGHTSVVETSETDDSYRTRNHLDIQLDEHTRLRVVRDESKQHLNKPGNPTTRLSLHIDQKGFNLPEYYDGRHIGTFHLGSVAVRPDNAPYIANYKWYYDPQTPTMGGAPHQGVSIVRRSLVQLFDFAESLSSVESTLGLPQTDIPLPVVR